MLNKVRIIYIISIAYLIDLVIGAIGMEIRLLMISYKELSFEHIAISIGGSIVPSIFVIIMMIIIMKVCKRHYKYPINELKIKNNYFFIGIYLLIHNLINSIQSNPVNLIAVIIARQKMDFTEHLSRFEAANILGVVFTLISLLVGSVFVVKGSRDNLKAISRSEE